MKTIVAAASFGGHWVQLLRLTVPMEKDSRIIYLSTNPQCATMVAGRLFFTLSDFSRWNPWRIAPALSRAVKLLRRHRPDAVLTTGAAPGLVVVLAAKLLGIRSVWVDSVANAESLSMCGKIASRIATETFTQWPHLVQTNVQYAGNVLGEDSPSI
ncbi:MAG: oligosaccharide biosynthesis protein Alg14 [Muribaculaceae bacterium]|nr:oligosaccharide biosynthesis protein Alg14 [Muribaculaceae bacterium]